ncbi:TAXI family TRAP transporter solute-binding subunit [Oricola sp.]|uniref:TAXI family TRAP transporter solute-binding subunit n=1 Tax=Oricola sp. TaxID=1979950 RepID=UPI0025CD3042|nr:TAXI family TRAP transporter solute-binding subunit [Oricola sp.]MCI5076966.1 TAXI family TRAP transporter solute-binding subunit [Oricola sp.]
MKHLTRMALAGLATVAMTTGAFAAEKLKMATIDPGSSAYLVMTTMANIVNEAQDDYEITVDATGAATKHMVEVASGKIDLCMVSPTVYHFMKTGKAMYSKLSKAPELSENLGLIYWFPYGAYHVVTYADSGMEKLEDIKGKKVFLGPPGGGAWNTANAWIASMTGYKAGEDYENVKASWGAALQAFQDRQIDVYINGGIPPYPQIEQLALTSKLRILGPTQAEVDAASDDMLAPTRGMGRSLDVIPAGIYGEGVVNEEDVFEVGSTVGVGVRMDLSEDTVYEITKAFWEGLPEVQKTTPFMRKVTLDGLTTSTNMPLHPGAIRYYKELGIDIPADMQ